MLNDPYTSCLPEGLHTPRRNAYFDGKLLLARDFVDEQDYARGHRHTHNALLHGTGTVCGLKLVQHPSPDCRREFVVLEPGMALDCWGREIIVPERTLVRVRELLDQDPDLAAALDGGQHLFVALHRCDSGAEPVPAILPGCEGQSGPTEFGRIAEGFEVVLSARSPSDVAPVEVPLRPRLDWVHTITLGAQVPRGVHLNDAEGWVQVAADSDAGRAHLYVHDDRTHDLVSLLEGPARITDTASSRRARLVLAAGEGFGEGEGAVDGVAFWRATRLRTDARPLAVLPLAAPASRIAVSPTSGTLFVLELTGADSARLSSWSGDTLDAWLSEEPPSETFPDPIQRLELPHGFGGEDDPALRGAAMMAFSHDGRFLALAGPGTAGNDLLYLIDVAAFNAGTTVEAARAEGFDEDVGLVAVTWSLDDAFLYVLGQRSGDAEQAAVTRHALTGDGNELERQGRGVSLDGVARDLAIAPTETGAYVLLDDATGVSRLTTVDNERIKAVSGAEPEMVELSADAVRIDGDGRSLAMAANGGRLHVAAADAQPAGLPDRGLVAVIDVTEDDCAVHIERLIDGCASCEGGDHDVVLGHLPFYVTTDRPRMVDADEAGDDDVPIDNVTYRPIVPSVQTLRDVIACMLARGVAEGPPGPRGDPGAEGADGLSITDVVVELVEPGATPAAQVTPNDTGLTLALDLPAAPPGEAGQGIDDVRLEYDDASETPTATIISEGGLRILHITLPAPRRGGALPPVNPIVALTWHHGGDYVPQTGNFFDDLAERGLALALETAVPWPFPGDDPARSMVVELQRRVSMEDETHVVWATIDHLQLFPLWPNDDGDPDAPAEWELDDHGLLANWHVPEEARFTWGFVLRNPEFREFPFESEDVLRLVFYSDFLVDRRERPVSGAHVGGELPTGRGGPAGTFRSWFTVRG